MNRIPGIHFFSFSFSGRVGWSGLAVERRSRSRPPSAGASRGAAWLEPLVLLVLALVVGGAAVRSLGGSLERSFTCMGERIGDWSDEGPARHACGRERSGPPRAEQSPLTARDRAPASTAHRSAADTQEATARDRSIIGNVVNSLRREVAVLVDGGPTWAIYTDEELQDIARSKIGSGLAEWPPVPYVEAGGPGAVRALTGHVLRSLFKRTSFGALKDHFARHGAKAGFGSASAYFQHAVRHLQTGRNFIFRHDGVFKRAAITRVGADSYWFTSASLSGKRVFTHMGPKEITGKYLRNLGITLPKGF